MADPIQPGTRGTANIAGVGLIQCEALDEAVDFGDVIGVQQIADPAPTYEGVEYQATSGIPGTFAVNAATAAATSATNLVQLQALSDNIVLSTVGSFLDNWSREDVPAAADFNEVFETSATVQSWHVLFQIPSRPDRINVEITDDIPGMFLQVGYLPGVGLPGAGVWQRLLQMQMLDTNSNGTPATKRTVPLIMPPAQDNFPAVGYLEARTPGGGLTTQRIHRIWGVY